jgi:hypothetical protein
VSLSSRSLLRTILQIRRRIALRQARVEHNRLPSGCLSVERDIQAARKRSERGPVGGGPGTSSAPEGAHLVLPDKGIG